MSEQKQKSGSKKEEEQEQPQAKESSFSEDLDGILEDIDEVLEENAAEFVSNYIQKGGQ